MKKKCQFILFSVVTGILLLFVGNAASADKVIVVPLGGTVGNAEASDVLKDKTFSSKTAGKGKIGTLEIRGGSTIYTNTIDMDFSLIPAGSFVMGSPDGTGDATHRPVWPVESGRNNVERQHVVTLTKSFYMQTTEVTQGQWLEVMGGMNPSRFDSCGTDCPVEMVSWNDVHNFIDALNAREGRGNCNTTPNNCYSLPTESQWEYAARGGTVTAFYNGDITNISCSPLDSKLDEIAWYCGNAGSTTHPVAGKAPNNWGLYDMSGNVYEWCEDLWGTGNYPDGPISDPAGGTTGAIRVIRGGSWFNSAWIARSANRGSDTPDRNYSILGFRVALALGQ